jgi:mRNA interferase RelE/StbE
VVEIQYSSEASRALRRCDKRKLVQEKIELLARDPLALSANVKRLKNREDYRLRVQNWRIVFEFEDGTLIIKDVVPRGAAYED